VTTRSAARLLEACARRGCLVCRCLGEDSARHLAALLHEHVTDPEVRAALRASHGLCNWHAGMLQELPGAAFGAAIVSADLLARERARAEALGRAASRRRSRLTALRRWLGSGEPAPSSARRPRRCLVCDGIAAAESRYLDALLGLVDDPRFEDAFGQSDGVCVPHLTMLVDHERGIGAAAAVARFVVLAAARWRRLEAALERFIAKHDYRARAPFTDEEGRAWRLALEMLAGAPGIFGNARRALPERASAPGPVRRKKAPSRDGLR
jgi:Family of unknown function (DUF6062)